MFLQKGDEILLISTARKISLEEITLATSTLKEWGLKVILGKNIFCENHQFAGTDTQRAQDLQWALDHPTAKAILCTRGGYGTSRLINLVNFDKFILKPKVLIGFSDITILHNEINNRNFSSLHATMPILFETKTAVSSLKNSLFNSKYIIKTKEHPFNKLGECKAEVIGGNLTLLIHGLGTSSEIETKGKILFIEEIDEYLYHVDRMLLQLKRANKLSKLKGLIIGGFSDMKDNPIPFGKTANEIIKEHCSEYEFPICFNFPSGHIKNNHALTFGKKTLLEIKKEEVRLTVLT